MCAKPVSCVIAVVLLVAAGGLAQNVDFQIVPLGGTVINAGPNPAILVEPGVVLPYEVIVASASNPLFPTTSGLAGFNFNVLTDLGLPQTSPFNFTPSVSPLFNVNPSLGTTSTDDIIGIGGSQNFTAPTGIITTGFALNQPQTLGNGQLLTPNREGTFGVNLVGAADLFNVNTGQTLTTTPGIVGPTQGFTIVTRFPDSVTPVDPSAGDGGDDDGDGGDGDGGDEPAPTPPLVGGPSGPTGEPSNDQVAGATPDGGPQVTGTILPGFCGLGVVSALTATLLGLGLMRRSRF